KGEQKKLLQKLIQEYTHRQTEDVAKARWARIRKGGMDSLRFAWMGSAEPGQGHYYRVQSSTFLIEYDNTQNNANHIHSVWREFNGDWGSDLLAQHYRTYPHAVAVVR
ncbi:MAG: DUF3500 domain-containing protein, partial [Armatimonadetes bacterium]|nr:DUF3500 domain-containing protein [Armatimonadota bacterium]